MRGKLAGTLAMQHRCVKMGFGPLQAVRLVNTQPVLSMIRQRPCRARRSVQLATGSNDGAPASSAGNSCASRRRDLDAVA